MRRKPPPLPPLPEPFPQAFRDLVPALLATRGRVDAGRVEQLRARRAVLSQSGTFVGHRRYERGDDLRHLDWAAYARTGELFTKKLQEEDRRAVSIVVDLSSSLSCGTPPRRFGALQLALVIGALGLARLDGVAVVAPGATQPVRRFAGIAQLPALLAHLRELPLVGASAAAPGEAAALALQGDSIGRVHWISDFAPPRGFARPLLSLRRRGAKLTGWLPQLPEDSEPPRAGYARMLDPETGEQLMVPIDAAFARELRRQLVLLDRQQQHMFAESGSPLLRWPVPPPTDAPRLADYLPIVTACAR